MCRHFTEDFGLPTRVLRYHNVYGPLGTFDGGRRRHQQLYAERLLMRKLIMIKKLKFGEMVNKLEVLCIDDCHIGTQKIFDSENSNVFNLGSSEQSIN